MWYNPIIKTILASPLHSFMSGSILVLTVTGRKSGKQFSLPVSYQRDGDTLTIFSRRNRRWWRNLQGGADVTVRLRGQRRTGVAHIVEADPEKLLATMQAMYSRMMTDEQIAEMAPNLVMIQVTLAPR